MARRLPNVSAISATAAPSSRPRHRRNPCPARSRGCRRRTRRGRRETTIRRRKCRPAWCWRSGAPSPAPGPCRAHPFGRQGERPSPGRIGPHRGKHPASFGLSACSLAEIRPPRSRMRPCATWMPQDVFVSSPSCRHQRASHPQIPDAACPGRAGSRRSRRPGSGGGPSSSMAFMPCLSRCVGPAASSCPARKFPAAPSCRRTRCRGRLPPAGRSRRSRPAAWRRGRAPATRPPARRPGRPGRCAP